MAPNHKVKQHSDDVVLQCHVTKENHYISTVRMPMARMARLDRMATHFEEFLPIKSRDILITRSCEITRQTKTIISLLPQCL